MTFKPTRQPRAHQLQAIKKAGGRPAFFYLCEMGTGKSKILLDEALQLYVENKIDRILVVAGKGSYADWMHKHLPENVPEDILVLAHLWDGGNSKAERAALQEMMEGPPVLRVLIMNVEAFGASKTAVTVAKNFVKGGKTLVACDESTKVKNIKAERTQRMVEIGKLAAYRRALTGSAVTKTPLDLWGQMSFLGLSEALGSNFFTFKARYCETQKIQLKRKVNIRGAVAEKVFNVEKITGYRNLDLLEKKMDAHSFRVLKSECLDLPPKIYQKALVELTDEQHTAYTNMVKRSMHEISDGLFASATHAMTRITRLHQIACGYITDENNQIHKLDNNRPKVLVDVIEEMTGKVAIWCAYHFDIAVVTEALNQHFPDRKIVTYYGPTSTDERKEAVQQFEHGNAEFWVGTAATGGYGITLVSCSNVIYYSNTFDLEHRLQSEDRFHRDGQTKAVTYVDLVAKRTVDEKIAQALRDKKVIADQVMGDGIREWLNW